MNNKKLEHYKGLLSHKIDTLIGKAGQTIGGMVGSETTFPDPNDRASMESERNFTLRIRDRERKLILKARLALSRITQGTYGYCDNCGEPISVSRLEARPEASLCIECKNENEDKEKGSKSIEF